MEIQLKLFFNFNFSSFNLSKSILDFQQTSFIYYCTFPI